MPRRVEKKIASDELQCIKIKTENIKYPNKVLIIPIRIKLMAWFLVKELIDKISTLEKIILTDYFRTYH